MSLKIKAEAQPSAKGGVIDYRDAAGVEPEALLRLYHQAPWAKTRTLDDTRRMLSQTDVCVGAWDGDTLVGFGRVLTDFLYRATIWDVIVDRHHQKRGIGTEIVQRILHHPRLNQVELFWLCTRRPGFYERLGFSSKAQTGLVWTRSEHAKQE
ncbi:MAG: GNAT family N-acetyltransferase [Nitrospiraceae bacterium]